MVSVVIRARLVGRQSAGDCSVQSFRTGVAAFPSLSIPDVFLIYDEV